MIARLLTSGVSAPGSTRLMSNSRMPPLLKPQLLAYKARTFDSLPYMLYLFSVPPAGWACGGAFIPAMIALFTRVDPPRALRTILLTAGVLCLAAPVLFSLQTVALMISREGLQPVFTGLQFAVQSTSSMELFFRWLPFVGGISLALGLSR